MPLTPSASAPDATPSRHTPVSTRWTKGLRTLCSRSMTTTRLQSSGLRFVRVNVDLKVGSLRGPPTVGGCCDSRSGGSLSAGSTANSLATIMTFRKLMMFLASPRSRTQLPHSPRTRPSLESKSAPLRLPRRGRSNTSLEPFYSGISTSVTSAQLLGLCLICAAAPSTPGLGKACFAPVEVGALRA